MGKSLAGDCDRLTLFRGPCAALLFNTVIRRRPSFLASGEGKHAR
jgi:hypothetical protein